MAMIHRIKGVYDILPEEVPQWAYVEQQIIEVIESYGYQSIRLPLLESTSLYQRSIGEATDIVEKEMYTFTSDKNKKKLTSLRPEGTAGCVRACIENGLIFNNTQRLWYHGPMFRRENPQSGRNRQFHQIGVEAFGYSGADIDIELLLMTWRCWKKLGILDHLTLQINTLGSLPERQVYKDKLVEYLMDHKEGLDEDSLRRLPQNPLRILDSKDKDTQHILKNAPELMQSLGEQSKGAFNIITHSLDCLGINYEINTHLVRGLDYYSHLVFEWVGDKLAAQSTICAGGRYDGLIAQLGGKPSYATGFAMGIERIILTLNKLNTTYPARKLPQLYFIMSDRAKIQANVLAEQLRNEIKGLQIVSYCGAGNFKKQFKQAHKSGAQIGVIIGDDELDNQTVTIKDLRDRAVEQQTIAQTDLVKKVTKII